MGIADDADTSNAPTRLGLGRKDGWTGGSEEFVAASWLRSQAAGVSPEGGDIRYIGDVDVASRLVHYARPVLEKLIEYTEDVPLSVAVSDNKGRVLSRLDTNSSIGSLVDSISLLPGFSYAESEVGTNGVGTVLESGRSVHIVGTAHFHERFHRYSCSGAPIRDPLSGHIEGVLDLTCLVEHSSPLLHSFVRSAASTIESALLRDRELSQRVLFDAFSRMEAKSRVPVMVAGKNVLISTGKAQMIFDADEQRVIVQHALYLAERTEKATDELEVSAQRIVKIKTTRISSQNSVVGVGVSIMEYAPSGAMQVNVVAAYRSAKSERVQGLSLEQSNAPAWNRHGNLVREAVERQESLMISGEVGVGKEALIVRAIHDVFDDVEVFGIETGFDLLAVEDKIEACAGGSALYILIRGLERLSIDEIDTVSTLLEYLGVKSNLVGIAALETESGVASGSCPPANSLLPLFGHSIHVPPLRHRTAELPRLAGEMLREMSNGAVSRINDDVVARFANYSWPGNLAELRQVLSVCLANQSAKVIKLADLPDEVSNSSTAAFGILESLEREAIVKSLEECEGNRVQAAKNLGIARSSLYRKIKTYKI
ncbi:helix-turn-helix domain-containing protein [Rhodococcus sp. 1168]|uniref:sigma-54-dependent Fis family transcriptional regulator n=1 Tax=Rhodococcus sp. 1168 TaxID=2018041 RepID=UPI0020CB1CDA|nr:helix-turn-helix domain-containing protein [Rhodococcus sp. 1168]